MVSRPGPLDEKTSPVMVVVMPDVLILPNPKSPPKRKIESELIFASASAPFCNCICRLVVTAAIEGEHGPMLRVTEGPLVSLSGWQRAA